MPLIQLNDKQKYILFLLYKFRFLTVFHLQKLLNHKNHRRIQIWLNDLIEKQCISRNYSRKLLSTPAAYFLTPTGIRVLRKENKDIFKPSLLRLNREKEKTKPFIAHWLFVANIYIKFLEIAENGKMQFLTEIEMIKDKEFLPEKSPDAYIAIQNNDNTTKRYFLKIIDDWKPEASLKKIIQTYIDYSSEGDWEANTNHPFPSVLFVAPTEKIKNFIFYYARNLLADEISDVSFFVTTRDTIKAGGVKKEVWRKIEEKPAAR